VQKGFIHDRKNWPRSGGGQAGERLAQSAGERQFTLGRAGEKHLFSRNPCVGHAPPACPSAPNPMN